MSLKYEVINTDTEMTEIKNELIEIDESISIDYFYQMAQTRPDYCFKLFSVMFSNELLGFNLRFYPNFFIPFQDQKSVEYFPAFREIGWTLNPNLFPSSFSKSHLRLVYPFITAMCLGLMNNSFSIAKKYSHQRKQGGRYLYEWSEFQGRLDSLERELTLFESSLLKLEENMSLSISILEKSDSFISQCMQLMGGVSYTEDYPLEKNFREVNFLKNYIMPLSHFKLWIVKHGA